MDYDKRIRDIFGDDSTDLLRDLMSKDIGPSQYKILDKIETPSQDTEESYSQLNRDK